MAPPRLVADALLGFTCTRRLRSRFNAGEINRHRVRTMAGIVLEGDHVSVEERAAHARRIAAEKRQLSLRRAAAAKARSGDAKLKAALAIPGTILSDEVVEPGPYSRTLKAGEHLRIIDLEGQQAVDFLCYDDKNPENRYNAANTLKLNHSMYI